MVTNTLAAIAVAIVTQDQTALHAAPRESSPTQAVLWQGDSLEIRGEKGEYLQVYDHRRERAGYVRASLVRAPDLKPEHAQELLSVVRFLRDVPGSESLGISYAAAYLRAAPAESIDTEIFEALGTMAERLARDASAGKSGKAGDAIAAHVEIAASYGVNIAIFERDGYAHACYDGDAHRRVLAGTASDRQKAQAALALTQYECVTPDLSPTDRFDLDTRRAEVLDRVDAGKLPASLKNRLHIRRAGIWAGLAYERARRADAQPASVREAAMRAIDELATVDKTELSEADAAAYNDAAMRVGASRWALEPGPRSAATSADAKLAIVTSAGQPGETCVHLVDPRHPQAAALATRCTYGLVWQASASPDSAGSALALAVQPTDTWRELWVFHNTAQGWMVDVLAPAVADPGIGYAEFAGWVPRRDEVLVAREARVEGHYRHAFEVVRLPEMAVVKSADRPDWNSTFYRWQSPAWKAKTVSLR